MQSQVPTLEAQADNTQAEQRSNAPTFVRSSWRPQGSYLHARHTKASYADGLAADASDSMHASMSASTTAGHSSGTRRTRRRPRSGCSWHTSSYAPSF